MYKINDIVVITTKTPYGCVDVNVENKVGYIIDILTEIDNITGIGKKYYEIFGIGHSYLYDDTEFRLATEEEVRNELIRIFETFSFH